MLCVFALKMTNLIKTHSPSSSQEAEKCGISPEELYAGILCSGNSTKPCDWLASELPHRLDEICAMAASVQLNYGAGDSGIRTEVERDREELEQSDPGVAGEGVKLSRAEAKLAWLAVGGDTDRAVRQLLRDRQSKVGKYKTCTCLSALSSLLLLPKDFTEMSQFFIRYSKK